MAFTGARFRQGGPSGVLPHWLPRGGALDAAAWAARHRGVCFLLWGHLLALPLIAVLHGETYLHGLTEAGVLGWFALGAEIRRLGARLRSASATLGLLVSSALVVHLFDGAIEAHFHFFVMVVVVALYQAWLPLLLALGFVLVHHGVVGTLAPSEVYNHQAAIGNPWLWGVVHAGFILAESIACLIYWHANEQVVARERTVGVAAAKEHRDLADAQKLSGIGSWEWDVARDDLTWSDQLYDLAGVDRATYVPTMSSFLELIHPDDRQKIAPLIDNSLREGSILDYECRMVRADGAVRTIHARGSVPMDVVRVDGRSGTYMRGTLHDVTERRRLQDAITQMAFADPLTGLANRRLFLDRLQDATATCNVGGTCAVLFVDLDGFKAVNDRYGHAVGDALLCEIATRLKSSVREADTVARLGGDEFAVLCEGGDHEVALVTASRIEERLRSATLIEGTRVVVSASIGIAVAGLSATADSLLRRADAAMYEVKTLRKQPRPVDRSSSGAGSPTLA